MEKTIIIRRGHITPEIRDFVLKRDGNRCRYCGSTEPPFHLDHVYPVIKGGETTTDNLVTACVKCNSTKHDKTGIYPKPIGYFEDHLDKTLVHHWLSIIALVIDILIFSLSMSDFFYGNYTFGLVELVLCSIVAVPIVVNRVVEDIKFLKE